MITQIKIIYITEQLFNNMAPTYVLRLLQVSPDKLVLTESCLNAIFSINSLYQSIMAMTDS